MFPHYWPKSGNLLFQTQTQTQSASNLLETDLLETEKVFSLEESEIYAFARSVLCENRIKDLSLFEAETHPDFYKIQPETNTKKDAKTDSKGSIKIDDIRAFIEWTVVRPQLAEKKVAILYPAESLNVQAANALLKTMEEGMKELLFILVCERLNTLPATVKSRCILIRAAQNNQSQNEQYALEQGVEEDLRALWRDEKDPVMVAAEWIKQDINRLLFGVMRLIHKRLREMAYQRQLQSSILHHALFEFLDSVIEARRQIVDKTQTNLQLLIESVLINWCRVER